MKKKTWFLGVAGILVVGALPFETSTHIVRGWWRGEAFYRARPTSFWSHEVHDWRHLIFT